MSDPTAASPVLPGPLLMRLSGLIEARYADVAAREGLTVQQSRILVSVWRTPAKMGAIGTEFGLGKTTMTGVVARMEELELVSRIPDPADRRGLVVHATDEGADRAARVVETLRAQIIGLLEVLGSADQRELTRMLGSVLQAAASGPTL